MKGQRTLPAQTTSGNGLYPTSVKTETSHLPNFIDAMARDIEDFLHSTENFRLFRGNKYSLKLGLKVCLMIYIVLSKWLGCEDVNYGNQPTSNTDNPDE